MYFVNADPSFKYFWLRAASFAKLRTSQKRTTTEGEHMERRKLGKNGPSVSALGLGCMGMSYAYGPADEQESLQVLRRYLELGGNFLDTAEVYGAYRNEG